MAQLKDLLVLGPSRFIGDVFANNLQAFRVTDNLIPIETNTYSLGSSDLKWKSLFIGTANTYGSTTQPIWWNNGVPQAITSYSGVAASANKLTANSGSANQPVYFANGVPVNIMYEINANINDGSPNRLAYYTAAHRIEDATEVSANIIFPAHYYTDLYNSSKDNYIHLYPSNTTSSSQTSAITTHFRTWNGSVYKELKLEGGGTMTWEGSSFEVPSGHIYAGTDGDTTKERQVGVRSGAGVMYMYSQGLTTGSRGIWVPAHGSGDAKSVFVVDTNNNITFNGSLTGNASTATKLATARNLAVALGSTTAVTFDGSANQNSIPVSGTLGIANGGTGQTSADNVFSNLSWTAGTASGPTLSITVVGKNRTAVIPIASTSASGIITTNAQTMAGLKNFQGGITAGTTSANGIGIAQTNGTGLGLSLYGGHKTATPEYGIAFAQTGNLGKFGDVQADWATYFTMNAASQRGWIWKQYNTTAATGMAGSLSSRGIATFKGLTAESNYIVFPAGGHYTDSGSPTTGQLNILLPMFGNGKNTMISFKVHVYTYNNNSGHTTDAIYTVHGYAYGTTGWAANDCKSYSEGYGFNANLTVRWGNNGTVNVVTIGETDTQWYYPKIVITDIIIGHSNDNTNWGYGWQLNISSTSSLTTTVAKVTDPLGNQDGRYNNILKLYREGTKNQDLPAGIDFETYDTDQTSSRYAAAYIHVHNDHDNANNGSNMVIRSGSNMFIGGGESPSLVYNVVKETDGTKEKLWLTADNIINVEANAGGTTENRIGFQVTTDGNIIPIKLEAANDNEQNIGASDNRWANVYATTIKANRINEVLVGTGTAGSSTANSTPSEWIFNAGLNSLADGDIVTIKIPVAGSTNGIWLSVDNGTKYYPICNSLTGRLTTHFAVGEYITIIFDSDGSAASVAPRGGGTQATQNGGVWHVINFYNTNTNTLLRVYSSSTDLNVPLIGQSSANNVNAAWTTYTGTYKDWYGAIPNDDSKRAKINLSTGTITVPGGIVGDLTGKATTATKFASAQSITLTGDTTGTVSSQAGWSLATTTKKLTNSGRLASANVDNSNATYLNKITYFLATTAMTEGKPPTDAGILNFAWDNAKWGSQLAIMMNSTPHVYLRGSNNTSWDANWLTVLDSNNYNNYAPTKTGTGATGTWGISITGSSAKLGTTTVGSATKPIYLNAGTATEGSTYAGGTLVTLNGTAKGASTASFYAPTGAGTSGQVLKSTGNSAPTWQAEYSYTLPAATDSALGGVRTGYSGTGKNYAVQLDTNNKMYVNVPWTDNNTTYTLETTGTGNAVTGVSLSGTTFTVTKGNAGLTGTVTVSQGGTGLTSFTTNKIYYASASTTLTASSHSINNTQMAINTTIQTGYALYVSGAFTATTLILPTTASTTNNAIWIGS